MGENSSIEWTDNTFNPWWGCTHVHEGCRNCYAETWAKRFGVKWGPSGVRRVASEKVWSDPIRWNRKAEKAGIRQKVFCSSMADVFEDWRGQLQHKTGIPMWIELDEYRGDNHPYGWGAGVVCDEPGKHRPLTMDDVRKRLFRLIDSTPWLDWQLVTKRPENIPRMWPRVLDASGPNGELETICEYRSNVWLLTSISDQASADKQIPALTECRNLSPVLGVSCEPLLGPIDLDFACVRRDISCIDWVIVGGESGNGARPMHPDWARSIRNQCQDAGVPFFYKQWGDWKPIHGTGIPDRDDEEQEPWTWISQDGSQHRSGNQPDAVMLRVGKATAGRILDGRTWDEFPEGGVRTT